MFIDVCERQFELTLRQEINDCCYRRVSLIETTMADLGKHEFGLRQEFFRALEDVKLGTLHVDVKQIKLVHQLLMSFKPQVLHNLVNRGSAKNQLVFEAYLRVNVEVAGRFEHAGTSASLLGNEEAFLLSGFRGA